MSAFDSAWSVLKAPQMVRFSQGPRGKVKTQKEKRYFRDLVKRAILQGKDVASDKRLSPEAMRATFGVDRVTEDMLDYKRDNRGRTVKDKDGKLIPNNPEVMNAFNEIFNQYYTKDRKREFRDNPQKYGATASFFEDAKDAKANRTGDFSRLDNTAAMNPQADSESTMLERMERMLNNFKPTTRKEVNKKASEILRNLGYKTYTSQEFANLRDYLLQRYPDIQTKQKPAPVDNTSAASRVASNLRTNPILPKDGDRQTTLGDFGGDLQENPIVPKPEKKDNKTLIEEMISRAEKLKQVADANTKAGKDVTAQGHLERLDKVMEELEGKGVGLDEYNERAKAMGIKNPTAADAVRPTAPPPKQSESTQPSGSIPLTESGTIDIERLGEMFASDLSPAKAPAKAPVKVQQTTQKPTGTPTLESIMGSITASSAPTAAPTAAREPSERDMLVENIRSQMTNNPDFADRALDEHKANNPIDDHLRLLGDVGHMGRLAEHVNVPLQQYSTVFQRLGENPEMYGLSPDSSNADIHNHIMGMFDPEMAY